LMKPIKYLIVCWCLVFPTLSFTNTSATNSQSALSAYKLAEKYRKESDWKNAIWNYKLSIQYDRLFALPYYRLGELYQQQHEFDVSIDYLHEYVKLRPKDPGGYGQLGLSYWHRKNYQSSLDNFLKVRELTPENYTANINVGLLFRKLEKYKQSIVALKRAVSIDPYQVNAYYLLARSYENLGMKKDYYREIQKAGDLNRDYRDIRERLVTVEQREEQIRNLWERANSYMSQKNYEDAISELKQYLELQDVSFDGYMLIGHAYLFQGDYENAIIAYDNAEELEPFSDFPHQALAMVYDAMDEKVICFKEISECLKLNPVNKDCIEQKKRFNEEFRYHAKYGEKLFGWEQFDQATKELRRALLYYPDKRELRLLLGNALAKSDNVLSSEKELKQLIKQFPEDKGIISNLGELYTSHNQENKAIALYQETIKRDLTGEDIQIRLELALLYEKIDKLKDALHEFNYILKSDPGNKKALKKIREYEDLKKVILSDGKKLYEQKQYEKAITTFERLKKLDENDYRIWLNIGRCYEQLKRTTEAINAYEEALKLEEYSYEVMYELGELILRSNPEKSLRAIFLLEKACVSDPNHIEAYLLLAQEYEKSGKADKAVMAMKQILRIDPKNQIAGAYIETLTARRRKFMAVGVLLICLLLGSLLLWNKCFFSLARKQNIKTEELGKGKNQIEGIASAKKARKRLNLCFLSRLVKSKKWKKAFAQSFRYEAETCEQIDQRESLLLKAIETYSADEDALLALASIAITSKKFDDGIKYAERAVLLEPTNDRALITLGKLHYYSGNYQEAEESFSKASQLKEKESLFHARSLQELGRHDEVINLIDSVSSPSERFLEDFLCCKACSLAEKKNFDEALENFEAAYKTNSKNFEALRNIAHCNYMLSRYEEASRLYSMLKSMDPGSVIEIKLQAAFSSLAAGDTENAKTWLMSCDATGWVTPYLLGKIIAGSDAPDVELAIEYFEKCLEIFESFPVKPDIYQNLAVLYADKMDFENALVYIGKFLKMGKTGDIPEFNLLEAYCLIGREDYIKAISLCINMLEENKLDVDKRTEAKNMLITAAFFSAKKNIAEGNYLGAGYAIEKIIELRPDLPVFKKALAGIYSNLARSLLNDEELVVEGKFEQKFIAKHRILDGGDEVKRAEQLIQKAELMDPAPDYTFNRAVLCIRLGEFSQAIEVLQQYEGEDRFNYLIALASLKNGAMTDSDFLLTDLMKSKNPEIRRKSKVIKAAYFLCPREEWDEVAELLLADYKGIA